MTVRCRRVTILPRGLLEDVVTYVVRLQDDATQEEENLVVLCDPETLPEHRIMLCINAALGRVGLQGDPTP